MTDYDVINRSLLTEKSALLTQYKKYTLKVEKKSNKIQIKKAIENIYGVKVKKVNVLNYIGKKKRVGRNFGKRPDWKKAVVTLTPESKNIEELDLAQKS